MLFVADSACHEDCLNLAPIRTFGLRKPHFVVDLLLLRPARRSGGVVSSEGPGRLAHRICLRPHGQVPNDVRCPSSVLLATRLFCWSARPMTEANALAEVHSRGIMARERPDCPVIQQKRRNRMLGSWLESSERPTAVVGHSPSGKSRRIG